MAISGPLNQTGFKTNRALDVSSIPFAFLTLSIISTPWNGEMLLGLRLNDAFLISAFIAAIVLLRLRLLPLFFLLLLFLIFAVSTLINHEFLSFELIERLIFYYKYLVPFLTIITFLSCVRSSQRIKLVENSFFAVFLVLIIWPYFYSYVRLEGLILGHPRTSFPGTRSFLISDAHLYSSYLAISLIFYFLHLKNSLRHHLLFSMPLVVVALGALVLTGSRNGILLVAISPLLIFLFWLISLKNQPRINIRSLKKIFFGSFVFLLVFFILFVSFFNNFKVTVKRAFDFNFIFAADASLQGRVVNFGTGIEDWVSNSLFFGASPFGASLIWFDSGLGILLAQFGLTGVLFVTLTLVLCYRSIWCLDRASREARAFMVILTLYIIANFITEFALVTRSVLPVVFCLMILYVRLLSKQKISRPPEVDPLQNCTG